MAAGTSTLSIRTKSFANPNHSKYILKERHLMKLILNPEFNLYERDGQAFCDSLQVAETFKKDHFHVLRDIDLLLSEMEGLGESNSGSSYFIQDTYKSPQNKRLPRYLMSRDGFTLLVMGYSGEKALRFKIAYIERFNQMEAHIKSLLTLKMDFPAFTEAVMLAHEEPKHYHFTNEINMIYRIVLGMDAKQYRIKHGLENGAVIRPRLSLPEIQAVESLQRVDIGLLEAGFDYDKRRDLLIARHHRTIQKMVS